MTSAFLALSRQAPGKVAVLAHLLTIAAVAGVGVQRGVAQTFGAL